MSLTRFAVRLCAARALSGATLAEDRVFQSMIDPIDTKVQEARLPMLIVNTDDHKQTGDGRDLTGGQDRLELVIEAAIASKVATPGVDGEGDVVEVIIPGTDAGMDMTLDILEHQVSRALTRGTGVWAALWRRLVLKVHERHSRRGADTAGVRYAARQTVLMCDVLADPVGGESLAPGAVWCDLLAAIEADATIAPMAPLIRAVIEGDGENPEWSRAWAMIGIGPEGAAQIGIQAPVLDDEGEPVLIEEIEIIDGDRE